MKNIAIILFLIASLGALMSFITWNFHIWLPDWIPFTIVIQEGTQFFAWLGMALFVASFKPPKS